MSIKNLFLLDAFGAFISALMSGLVLVNLQSYIGMPIFVLQTLALFACVFTIYSFTCYFLNSQHSKTLLKIIGLANLAYCLLSIILMVYFYQVITVLGFTYFILEKIIILLLVFYEFNAVKS